MTRTTRTTRAALGGIAVAVALGVSSPAALAAAGSHGKPAHAQTEHSKGGTKTDSKADSKAGTKGGKGSQLVRQVLAEIARVDARLALAGRDSRLASLDDATKASVLASITADRTALDVLEVQAATGPAGARELVRRYSAENYLIVVNDLRHAALLMRLVDEAAAGTDEDEVTDEDGVTEEVTEGDGAALDVLPAELAEIQDAVEAAVGNALLVTARSSKTDLQAVKAELTAAHEALEAYLASLEEQAEEDTEGDTEGEPVEPVEPVV